MSTEASELQRSTSVTVRDMLEAYRTQAQSGSVTVQALDVTIFRPAHPSCTVSRPTRPRSGPHSCRASCI